MIAINQRCEQKIPLCARGELPARTCVSAGMPLVVLCLVVAVLAFAPLARGEKSSSAAADPGQLNALFGLPLWAAGGGFWDQSVDELLLRLPVRLESGAGRDGGGAAGQGVYSAYTRGMPALGAQLMQLSIATADGRLRQIDMVFANKGDSVESRERDFRSHFRQTRKAVAGALRGAFGLPQRGRVPIAGKAQMADYWQIADAIVVMDDERNEFIIVRIIPGGAAAAAVPSARELKKQVRDTDFSQRVRREANGDVYIAGIPMVNQGDKGYCAPSTIERCFRYYGVQGIDMHRIAEESGTAFGGGTAVRDMINAMRPYFRRYGLRLDATALKFRQLQREINAGYPMLWTLYASDEFLMRMQGNSLARQRQGFQDWVKVLRKQKVLPGRRSGAHICLIIGYNAESNEIAISNSWGPGYEIHWVSMRDAEAVTQDRSVYVVRP